MSTTTPQDPQPINLELNDEEYSVDCDFKALHPPDIKHIITEQLPLSNDFEGNKDFMNLQQRQLLTSPSIWNNTIQDYVKAIDACMTIAKKKTKLKDMQKKLVEEERHLCSNFRNSNYTSFVALATDSEDSDDDEYDIGDDIKWKGILGLLCIGVLNLVKQDMCSNKSTILRQVASTINSAFTLDTTMIHANYNKLTNGDKVMESIYYISGWLMQACKKASARRRISLREVMIDLVESGTVHQQRAKDTNLPVLKVERTMEFGGLKFVSSSLFNVILRLEHVFVLILKPNFLAVLGHDIITRLYNELLCCSQLREMIKDVLSCDAADDDLSDLMEYLIQTYCRMRGKDYCRQMMATDFNTLGKCVRSKLAVLSDKESYEKNKGSKKKGANRKGNAKNTTASDTTATTDDNENDTIVGCGIQDIHNIFGHLIELVDDDEDDPDSVGEDEVNLLE